MIGTLAPFGRFLRRVALVVGGSVCAAGAGVVAVVFGGLGASRHLDDLDPSFRGRAVGLLDAAARHAGTTYDVRETARPAWRQELLYQASLLPFVRFTKVRASQSCHVTKGTWRGARAVDVTPHGKDDAVRSFYLYLRKHAAQRGLRSGAAFGARGANSIGWDPGHLELQGCGHAPHAGWTWTPADGAR